MQSGLREVIPVNDNPEDPDVTVTFSVTGKLSEVGEFAGGVLAAHRQWTEFLGEENYKTALKGRLEIAFAEAVRDQIGERHLVTPDDAELAIAFELAKLLLGYEDAEVDDEPQPVVIGAV
jgi:hypothetical protein